MGQRPLIRKVPLKKIECNEQCSIKRIYIPTSSQCFSCCLWNNCVNLIDSILRGILFWIAIWFQSFEKYLSAKFEGASTLRIEEDLRPLDDDRWYFFFLKSYSDKIEQHILALTDIRTMARKDIPNDPNKSYSWMLKGNVLILLLYALALDLSTTCSLGCLQ